MKRTCGLCRKRKSLGWFPFLMIPVCAPCVHHVHEDESAREDVTRWLARSN